MTIRWPAALHERLRKASFETRVPVNTIAVQGALAWLAALDDTMARALAEADPDNVFTWEGLGTNQARYRQMAARALELLTGVTQLWPCDTRRWLSWRRLTRRARSPVQ